MDGVAEGNIEGTTDEWVSAGLNVGNIDGVVDGAPLWQNDSNSDGTAPVLGDQKKMVLEPESS